MLSIEHCVLRRFELYFITSDNQFGFKKHLGSSWMPHAIYTVRSVVNHYVSNGSTGTLNVCAIDISKAFDRMNHFGLFIKLMDRFVNVLLLLEDWYGKCFTGVKWDSLLSCMFQLTRGIRQGGVLSPYLFALYVDDVMVIIEKRRSGCL